MEQEKPYKNLDELMRYGLTFNDIYDLAKLRAYEAANRQYRLRNEMPYEAYL